MEIVTDIEQLQRPAEWAGVDTPIIRHSETLLREMEVHRCQGLAAPQVGIGIRIFVMLREVGPPICIVNPEITKKKGNVKSNETCLSIPGRKFRVPRPARITVQGDNIYWRRASYKLTGIEARRACHEIDHLDGKLIIDYEEVK